MASPQEPTPAEPPAPAEPPPPAAGAPLPPAGPSPTLAGPPPGPSGSGAMAGSPQYGGYGHPGFAPVPRAARVPWVNPARRLQVVLVSFVAGLLLLGTGMAIGAVADGGHRGRYERFGPTMGNEYGPNFGPPGTWRRGRVHAPGVPVPTPTAPPTG